MAFRPLPLHHPPGQAWVPSGTVGRRACRQGRSRHPACPEISPSCPPDAALTHPGLWTPLPNHNQPYSPGITCWALSSIMETSELKERTCMSQTSDRLLVTFKFQTPPAWSTRGPEKSRRRNAVPPSHPHPIPQHLSIAGGSPLSLRGSLSK